MPALAQVPNSERSQSTYLVTLQRSRNDSWGFSWNYDSGVGARRLLVSGVSPCSPAGRAEAGSLRCGDELLSANGVAEHEDMLRELEEALEAKILFRSVASSPTTLSVSCGSAQAVEASAAASALSRWQAPSELLKARVKNTFLHFSESGESEGTGNNDTPSFSKTDPLPISHLGEAFQQYRSPYMRGCLAGLDLNHHATLNHHGSGHPGNVSPRSISSSDGTTSVERVSSGIASYPSTDWDFPSYHHAPIQQPLYCLQPVCVAQTNAGVWPSPRFGVSLEGQQPDANSAPQVVVPLRVRPDLGSSSSEDVASKHTGRSAEVPSSDNGAQKNTHSDPDSRSSEAARSEAGPPLKSNVNLFEVEKWTKPDDPMSSMDESTTYASTLSSQQKRARRGGKRMNRPCHLRAKEERSNMNNNSDDDYADPQGRSFYPSLTKQELEQANLNRQQPHTLKIELVRQKVLSLQGELGPPPAALEHKQPDVAPPETKKWSEQTSDGTEEETALTMAPEDVNGSSLDLVGKRALLQGLARMPEFNGEWGTIMAYEQDTHRYKVSVQRTSRAPLVAKLRRQNLCIPAALTLDFCVDPSAVTAQAPAYCAEDWAHCTVPTTFQMDSAEVQQPREALKSTQRRAALRRYKRQNAAAREASPTSQKTSLNSFACKIEDSNIHPAPISSVASRRLSCPPSSRHQVSSACTRAKSARQLRREPSCPRMGLNQLESRGLVVRPAAPAPKESNQMMHCAISAGGPAVAASPTSSCANSDPVVCPASINASEAVEVTPHEKAKATGKGKGSLPAAAKRSVVSPPIPVGPTAVKGNLPSSPPAASSISNDVYASTPDTPGTRKASSTSSAGNVTASPFSSSNSSSGGTPDKATCSEEPLAQDVCGSSAAAGDYEAPKKWQRHRAAREVQGIPAPPARSGDGTLVADGHSGTVGTTAPEVELGTALSWQGARTAIAVKDSCADATKWRPTLRLCRPLV